MYSVEQDDNASALNSGEEISGELVVACGDGSEVFDFVEKSLDEVAFAVERVVAGPLGFAIRLGWNDWGDSPFSQAVDERVGVVGLVGEQSLRIDALDERLGASQIVGLSRRELQFDGISQGVDERVDFGGQSAAGSTDRLRAVFFRALALCW